MSYRGLGDFARRCGMHRNTLHNLLKGGPVFSRSLSAVADGLSLDPMELVTPRSSLPSALPGIDEISGLVAHIVKAEPGTAVVLFGSRAAGRGGEYSDWDLGVLRRPRPLTGMEYLRLRRLGGDLAEGLPREVDLMNFDQAPREFLAGMTDPPVFLDGNREAYSYLMGMIDGIRKGETAQGRRSS